MHKKILDAQHIVCRMLELSNKFESYKMVCKVSVKELNHTLRSASERLNLMIKDVKKPVYFQSLI